MAQITCYTLYPCGDNYPIVTTTTNLSSYLGTKITIGNINRCYWVALSLPGQCITPVNVTPTPATNCCPSQCYYLAAGEVFYIDASGHQHTQFGPVQFCSIINPITYKDETVVKLGLCELDGCPTYCYKLTNCDNVTAPLYTTSETMLPYAIAGATVTLVGQEGCWEPTISMDNCECAINLIVNEVFAGCPDCTGYTTYKLTNCDDSSIIYTSDDLSLYVDKTVEIDPCAGCWFVEQLDYQGPSDQSVTVTNVFDDCEACSKTYYLLEDCANVKQDIVTSTDLSTEVGKVITLKWCPDVCWEVTETRDISNSNPTVVFPTGTYLSCPACAIAVLPCECQTAVNTGSTNTLTYINCSGNTVNLTVPIGQKSSKICAKSITSSHSTVVKYGDCVNNTCPPLVYPKATIIPGYNTPTCTPDKYEQITCTTAEILYKHVLERRYGISNCCPDEDNAWLIKKELIDLAAMVDPDYTCEPPATCDCAPSNCSCKTCNS
jgi:hypothetical protein